MRERRGYFRAFSKIADVSFLALSYKEMYWGLSENLFPIKPDFLIHADNYYPRTLLKIERLSIPSVCFHFDTYSDTENRILFSSLFDIACVAHPQFVSRFQDRGIKRCYLFPHAVERDEFDAAPLPRKFDIGWVGRLDGAIYKKRWEVIKKLSSKYVLNDIHQYYNYEALSSIYQQSKIGVNFSRSDYPEDANLRCFEIMAGGALLLTGFPSELELIGLKNGVHYVTYYDYDHLVKQVDYYLAHPEEQRAIAAAGQELTLREHTYDARVESLMKLMKGISSNGKRTIDRPDVHFNYALRKGVFNSYFSILDAYPTADIALKIHYFVKFVAYFIYRALRKIFKPSKYAKN